MRSTLFILFLAAGVSLIPQVSNAAVSKFVGIESGVRANGLSITTVDSSGNPVLGGGGGACTASDIVYDGIGFIGPGALPGPRAYAPNITGSWSSYAYHGYCKYPIIFGYNQAFGDNLHVGYMWLYISGAKIPKETDIRVCLQAKSGSTAGPKACTPWASTLDSGTEWGDAPFAYDSNKKDAETFRIKVDSRPMPGRSITDVRLRLKMIDIGKESSWITTKWSSQGGGWASLQKIGKTSYYIPAGTTGDYGDGAKVGMLVKKVNSPAPDLTVTNVGRDSGSTIQGSTITLRGTVTNGGNLATGNSFTNLFQYRWSPSDAWSNLGGLLTMTALNAGASQTEVSSSFALTRAGNLEVRLLTDYVSNDPDGAIHESDESDNIASSVIPISPPPGCTFNGTPVAHGGTVTAYQASSVPFGSPCISETRTCTNGVLSGSYTNASCSEAAGGSCTRDGITLSNGQSRTFYSVSVTPSGESCASGTDAEGRSYDASLTCTNGTFTGGGSDTDLYRYSNCLPGAPVVLSNITLSTNQDKVRAGNEVRLTWDGGNAASCTLSGTNGFYISASSGTDVLSGPIDQKTVFTLTCRLGASTREASATVDIVAAVKEI